MSLPADAAARKNVPLARGLLDYFPDALCAVAELSRIGNEQHNPGQPMHWAKEKSTDEPDALLRHLIDRGKVDSDGVRHSAKVAWRALALLQREIEAGTMHTEPGIDLRTPPPAPRPDGWDATVCGRITSTLHGMPVYCGNRTPCRLHEPSPPPASDSDCDICGRPHFDNVWPSS